MLNFCGPAEVVYVGVVQSKHLEVATMMMRAGKHVLCEKPMCMNVRETQEMLDVAKQNKVFLMEVREWCSFWYRERKFMA